MVEAFWGAVAAACRAWAASSDSGRMAGPADRGGGQAVSVLGVRSQQAVVADEVREGRGYQGDQPAEKLDGLERQHRCARGVGPRPAQPVVDPGVVSEAETPVADSRIGPLVESMA